MSNKKAAEARRKAFEREEKIWKRDKFAFIAAVAAFIVSILHRVLFKPDVMTGEKGLRAVFLFSLLRIILGLAAEVSFGVALGRIMLIKRSEPLVTAADTMEKKYGSRKKKKKQGKAGRIAGFVLLYVFLFLMYMSFGVRETALYSQRNIKDFSRFDNLSYAAFAGSTFMDMTGGETVAVEVSGTHIGTDSISYAITSRRYNSRRHSSLTYRFSVLEDSSYENIVQVSEKEGKELEETLDREKTYIIRLYKHSGLLASIEEKQYE